MEMIVALGIFTTVVASVSNIFMLASRSQRKVFTMDRAQSDARFVMEAIAREVRMGTIDFSYYAGLPEPFQELAMIDTTGQSLRFHRSTSENDDKCADANSNPCLLVTIGSNEPEAVTPKGVKILNTRFYVTPKVDPWEFHPELGGYASNEQPRVTIVLVTESSTPGKAAAVAAQDRSIMYVQTTVTSRNYKR